MSFLGSCFCAVPLGLFRKVVTTLTQRGHARSILRWIEPEERRVNDMIFMDQCTSNNLVSIKAEVPAVTNRLELRFLGVGETSQKCLSLGYRLQSAALDPALLQQAFQHVAAHQLGVQ